MDWLEAVHAPKNLCRRKRPYFRPRFPPPPAAHHFGWRAEIGEFEVAMWISWVSLAVAGYLALSAYRLLKK